MTPRQPNSDPHPMPTAHPHHVALAGLGLAVLVTGCLDPNVGLGMTGTSEAETSTGTTDDPDDDSTTRPGVMTTTVSGTSSTSGDSASDSDDTDDSTTGPDGPVCGNGIVEPDETCDDGNDFADDGCHNCEKDLIVFLTSEVYQGNTLEGLTGADARCQLLAAQAELANPLRYRAWLSTPTVSAASRLRHSRGRYVLVNGMAVAYGWDALTSMDLALPIMLDEKSQVVPATRVWTGSHPNGEPVDDDSSFCNDWDYHTNYNLFAPEGRSMSQDAGWSYYGIGYCGQENRLYCFET